MLTGANGNIGSFLYSRFNTTFDLTAISKSYGSNLIHASLLDLTNEKGVIKFVREQNKFDVLIFLVGLAHSKGKGKEIHTFRKINVKTLKTLLSTFESQKKLPGKIIFASTISVYGEKIYHKLYSEESIKTPTSPYAMTKVEAEQYLLKNFGGRSWILRFAPVYSPDFKLNIMRRVKIMRHFYRVEGGKFKLSLCHIKNIGDSIDGIIKDNIPPGVYNISDECSYSYNDLLRSQNANWIIPIPRIFVNCAYLLGKLSGNLFLVENSIKLLSDNLYPSDKIRKHIQLIHKLEDKNFGNHN